MDRYYKIAKDSETGKKFAELVQRVFDFKNARNEFFLKYGIKKYRLYDMYLVSVDAVFFIDESSIDRANWKSRGDKTYIPKKNPKDKQLKKDWENLQSKKILRSEVDKIVGCKDPFHHCGFDYSVEDYFFIFTDKPEAFDFPSDVKEISNLEYLELTKQK